MAAATLTPESALEAQGIEPSRPVLPAATFRGSSPTQAQCDFSRVQGVVWSGTKRQMTLTEFASYAAPVYWFSPDEPVLDGRRGKNIRIPAALPFQDQPESPVVYYQFNAIGERKDVDTPAFIPDSSDWGNQPDYQMRAYPRGTDPAAPDQVIVNVWDWDADWTVVWYQDGDRRGAMSRRVGFDPLSVDLHTGDDLPPRRTWVEPYPTNHLFYAPASQSARSIIVEATDRFGRTYTAAV